MKQRNRLYLMVALVAMALVMFSGCDPVTILGEGTLSIGLESSSRSLTLLPEIDMDIATHTITGSGPEGDSFTEEGFAGAVFEQTGLTVGDWEIVVDGYNAGGTRIGTAVVELTIRKNQTTSATATLRPLEGTGTFSGTVSWTDSEGLLSDPQVWVTVRDEEGDDIPDISVPTRLDVEGSTASGSAQLPAGWYEVTVGLYEGVPGGEAMVVWRGMLAVRIVADQTTSGTLEIPEGQIRFGTGGVSIVIEEDMDDPFDVFFTAEPEAVVVGNEATFTSTGTHSDSARYRWYIDGERQDGSSALFSHTFMEAGEHTVSLLVVDGGAMGGYGQGLTVLDNSAVQTETNAMWNDYTYISWQNLQHVYQPDKTNASIDTWKVNSDGAPIDGENRILWNNQPDLVNGISLFFYYTDDSIYHSHMSSVESGWNSEVSQDAEGNGIIQFTRETQTAIATITYTLSPSSSSIIGEIEFEAKDYGHLSWGVNLISGVWVRSDPGEIALYDKAYINEQEITASDIGINPDRVEGIDYLRECLVSSGIAGIRSTEKDWELSFELLETTKNIDLESRVTMSSVYGGWGFDRLAGVMTYLDPGETITIKGKFYIE